MTLNTETLELSDSVNSEVDDSKMSILKLSKRQMLRIDEDSLSEIQKAAKHYREVSNSLQSIVDIIEDHERAELGKFEMRKVKSNNKKQKTIVDKSNAKEFYEEWKKANSTGAKQVEFKGTKTSKHIANGMISYFKNKNWI